MATYRTIAASEIDADSPVTATLMAALEENPAAIAEGATDAPVVASAWHPYDAVTVGDGADGLIWDQSVDGSLATITTPDFEDGYEYALFIEGVTTSATSGTFSFDLYKEVDAAYQFVQTAIPWGGTAHYGLVRIMFPRIAKQYHGVVWESGLRTVFPTGTYGEMADNTVQKILRARFDVSSGTINGGKIYMHRRREYISG